ncbi:MAG TPA: hypothetical protein VI072_13780 [Polyangiaceae bacterium]
MDAAKRPDQHWRPGWKSVNLGSITLTKGTHVLRVAPAAGEGANGWRLSWFELDRQ